MSLSFPATCEAQPLFVSLELSKDSRLLAIQLQDREYRSLHLIEGGDNECLIAVLDAAGDSAGSVCEF